ncbi:MAG: hypothetical protein RQ864_01705 [Lutibacter sp.]|nr:hypothetical protein [Lutibacter sp.]MDT8416500.1 hypothetical protein [Lutibacter sp.]
MSVSVLDDIRNQFPEINSMEEAEFHMKLLEKEKSPEAKAYYAAMLFMKAKYVKFPLSKYNNFKKGKSVLDQVIQENKSNVELRYLRYVFQNELPAFLNYDSNIEEDFSAIANGIDKSNLTKGFKHKIVENMLLVKGITANQTAQLKLLLNKI